YVPALHGLFAVLVALDSRARTGRGQLIEVSQLESAVSVLGSTLLDFELNDHIRSRSGNRHVGWTPHGVYQCAGIDRWIALAVTSDAEWHRFAELAGRPFDQSRFATLDRRKHREDDLDALVSSWTSSREAEWLVAELVNRGITANVV